MAAKRPIWKEGLPYPASESISMPSGMSRFIAHDGRKDMLPFLNDCAIAEYGGSIYVAWYNSTNTEIGGSSLIRGCRSADGGLTWSAPFRIVGEANFEENHYVPPNLFVHGDRLHAIITHMERHSAIQGAGALELYRLADPGDPDRWEKVSDIAPGFVMTAAPVLMDNGCYAAGAWMSRRGSTPSFSALLISQGADIEKPWRCVFVYDPLLPGALDLRCAEIGIIVDGRQAIAYVRDDIGHPGDPSGGGHCWAFVSGDYGETWSKPILDDSRIENAKVCAGRLSNGRHYKIYNDDRGFFNRSLLLVAVTEPGEIEYSKVFKVFEGGVAEFGGRGHKWFYPCAHEYGGHLYIAITMEEADRARSAAVAKIPVESL